MIGLTNDATESGIARSLTGDVLDEHRARTGDEVSGMCLRRAEKSAYPPAAQKPPIARSESRHRGGGGNRRKSKPAFS
jgi:hypothetical protein